MSTLPEEIEALKRRLAETSSTQEMCKLRGRLEGLRQRQLNHENLQVEIAKHLGWIEGAVT